jgi:hypothetical protein
MTNRPRYGASVASVRSRYSTTSGPTRIDSMLAIAYADVAAPRGSLLVATNPKYAYLGSNYL